MGELFNRYVIQDFWVPVWPNIAASIIWAVPAFIWHHNRLVKHFEKKLAEALDTQTGQE